MKRFYLYFLVLAMGVTSVACSSSKPMNKAINNNNPVEGPKQRLELANKYYEEGDFYKAIQLYEIVIQERIMVDDLAEVYFRYANSHYAQSDYVTASSLFNSFYLSYPDDINAETAYYYKALCTYQLAEDDYRLDQSTMVQAMKEFQDYLINYPEGEYANDAVKNVEKIKATNEMKELNVGKLYFKIGEYKAAIEEFERFIEDFPTSGLVEEAYFEILRSRFELAKYSIESKKKERFERVIREYGYFMEKYSYGPYAANATKIKIEATKELEIL